MKNFSAPERTQISVKPLKINLIAIYFDYTKANEQKMIWQSTARQGVNYRIYEVKTGDKIKYEI